MAFSIKSEFDYCLATLLLEKQGRLRIRNAQFNRFPMTLTPNSFSILDSSQLISTVRTITSLHLHRRVPQKARNKTKTTSKTKQNAQKRTSTSARYDGATPTDGQPPSVAQPAALESVRRGVDTCVGEGVVSQPRFYRRPPL